MKSTSIKLSGTFGCLLSLCVASTAWAALSKEASLQKCQETAQKEAQKYEQAQTKALDECLKAANKQLLVKGKSAPDNKAAALCAKNLQLINDTRNLGKSLAEKLSMKIKQACDPATNPNLTHTLDDVTGKGSPTVGKPLNTKNIDSYCQQYTLKSSIDNVDDWIECQKKAHDAAVVPKQSSKFPNVSDLLALVKTAIDNLPTSAKNPTLKTDAKGGIDNVRLFIDFNNDGDPDLICTQN